MYDFLRSPRWIVSHVLILVLIVSMIGLGFWQRARWLEQSAQKDRIESRSVGRPVPLDKVVGRVTDPDKVAESVEYQRVTVTGRYDTANEVAIRNRSLNTAPGAWVLTPLVQADGTAIAVVRGWVPIDAANPKLPFPGATPPSGQVTVTGVVQRTEERGAIGPTDPATGHLDSLARVDLGRLAKQYRTPLEPVWMLLDTQQPPQPKALPDRVTLDIPSPSQNLSYMVQWWIFTLIAIVGYPLIIRRVARNKANPGGHRSDEPPLDDPPPIGPPSGPVAGTRTEPPVASEA